MKNLMFASLFLFSLASFSTNGKKTNEIKTSKIEKSFFCKKVKKTVLIQDSDGNVSVGYEYVWVTCEQQ